MLIQLRWCLVITNQSIHGSQCKISAYSALRFPCKFLHVFPLTYRIGLLPTSTACSITKCGHDSGSNSLKSLEFPVSSRAK